MTTLAFMAIIGGGLLTFRTWFGIVPVVIGLWIVPWHYIGVAAALAALFALVLIFGPTK